MSKFSVKTLLIIFLSLLIAIVVLWKFVLPKQQIKAAWWNDSWHYRKIINIVNNTNFDATNIPYKISLDTASLITASKLQADADDIRIIDQNGNLIRSQVEKKTLNTNASVIWFEVTIKSNSSSSYYLYYGNQSATAPNFESDVNTFSSTSTSTTIEMKDGFGYTTSNGNGGKISDIRKNSNNLGVDGNNIQSSSYPGNWWSSSALTQTILNSTGPLFAEITYGAGTTGSYSSYGTNIKVFDNGFAETQIFTTYNTSGSESFYYYLSFDSGTRNSVWVDGSGNLVDQDANSGNLTEANLGQKWFGQRWTSTGNYGGTIITKNGSDWTNGGTSTRASYYQTNYSYTQSFTNGSSREVRFGVFAGNGGLAEMQQKGANYGALSLSLLAEESGGGPVAYWKFDEGVGTTAYDSGNNKLNAILSNPKWETGINGNAFDGSSGGSIFIPDNNLLDISDNLTISFWYFPRNNHSNYANHPVQKWTGTGDANFVLYEFGNSGSGNTYMWYANRGGVWGNISDTWAPSTLNKWYFVSLVYNSTTGGQLYIDGKPIGTKKGSGLLAVNSANLSLLSDTSSSKPSIDEFKIYPYARTAAQIKLDYNSRGSSKGSSVNLGIKSNTTPSLSSKLIAYYKFDEKNGNITYDSLNKNNIGTITGAIWSPIKSGIGLSFDGSGDYITLSSSPLNNATVWSITTKLKYINKSKQFEFFLGKNDNGTTGKILLRYNGNLCFRGINGTYYNFSTTSNEIDNLDTNLSFVSDGTNIKLYINGIYKSTVTPASTSMSLNIIGNAWSDTAWQSVFLLDELKIYNSALTDEEIKQDYNSGSAISFGSTTQNIGGTTTSLDYCIPGDTSYCASPVAEWNFEENTGTVAKDTSGNNNNGTLSTGNYAPVWTFGQNNKGSGVKFSGESNSSSYISTSFPSISPTSYTAEIWIKPKTLTDASGFGQTIMAASVGYYPLWITLTNIGDIRFYAFSNSTSIFGQTSNANIQTNKWYHIAVSATLNGNANIYINGIKITSFTASNTNWPTAEKLTIGDLRPNRNISFNGSMDDVKIYNYIRTPAQVAYDYNKGAPVAWWKLDECQGLTAFDASGFGNNGAIIIGSSGTQTSAGTCQVGTSAAWTNGASGHTNSSLNFDGVDDYITTGSIGNTLTSMTVSIWIKTPTFNRRGTLISKWGTSKYSWMLFTNYWTADGHIDFLTSNNGTSYARAQTPSNTIIANKWQNIVGVYTGSSMYIYVDGILKATQNSSVPTSLKNVSTPLTIGADWDHSDTLYRTFNGQIDDVRIYNYALTSEQIKQIYNGGAINFN